MTATSAPPTTRPTTVTAGEGLLQVGVYPWAEITVDGRRGGHAPAELTLPAGEHIIVFDHPKYVPRVRRVIVLADQVVTTYVDLTHEDE